MQNESNGSTIVASQCSQFFVACLICSDCWDACAAAGDRFSRSCGGTSRAPPTTPARCPGTSPSSPYMSCRSSRQPHCHGVNGRWARRQRRQQSSVSGCGGTISPGHSSALQQGGDQTLITESVHVWLFICVACSLLVQCSICWHAAVHCMVQESRPTTVVLTANCLCKASILLDTTRSVDRLPQITDLMSVVVNK